MVHKNKIMPATSPSLRNHHPWQNLHCC